MSAGGWPAVAAALLITNLATLYLAHTRRARSCSSPQVADAPNPAAAAVQPTAHQDADHEAEAPCVPTVASSPPALALTAPQRFLTQHTVDAPAPGGDAADCTVQRLVLCMDTNAYLDTIALAPAAPKAKPAAAPVRTASLSQPGARAGEFAFPPTDSWHGYSVVTSVPDVSETGLPLGAWRVWFRSVCTGILQRLHPDQVAFFYQTDIRVKGQWVSKAQLVMQAAEKAGLHVVFHKIVLINTLETVRGSTASYVHLLCVAREHREDPAMLTPDVLPGRGKMLWKRAMGLNACEFAVRYLRVHVPQARGLIDPFCGSGSTLAMANLHGLHSVGVDHCRSRCVDASVLSFASRRQLGGIAEEEAAFQRRRKEEAARRKEERRQTGRTQQEQQRMEIEERKRRKREELEAAQRAAAEAQVRRAASGSSAPPAATVGTDAAT